jgi:transporter family protein
MHWILLAVMTAVFFGAYNVFIKMASGHINQIVGAVILQVVAALLGGIILLVLKISDSPLEVSSRGVILAVLAGIFVGLAEITSFYVFSRGISASVGIPIIIGGSVVVGAVLGVLFLKESLNWTQLFAIGMIVAGVVLLSSKS